MKQRLFTIFSSILFTILFISAGLCVVLFFRPLYYIEMVRLNIEETSGYSSDEIKENYNALIDYCSPFYGKELNFPSFPSSKEGILHFKEVKQIFYVILIGGFFSLLLLIPILIEKKRAEEFHYLHSSALATAVLPLFILLVCSFDFEKTFTLFHSIAFRNDYWIFSEKTDPIIKILPQQFFLDCAIFLVCFVLLGSIALEVCYRIRKKTNMAKISQT
ncbi:MAG: TIGR01906 family membrane protein [Velocimicrobium sp.]